MTYGTSSCDKRHTSDGNSDRPVCIGRKPKNLYHRGHEGTRRKNTEGARGFWKR